LVVFVLCGVAYRRICNQQGGTLVKLFRVRFSELGGEPTDPQFDVDYVTKALQRLYGERPTTVRPIRRVTHPGDGEVDDPEAVAEHRRRACLEK
jgi:hypothetical protein